MSMPSGRNASTAPPATSSTGSGTFRRRASQAIATATASSTTIVSATSIGLIRRKGCPPPSGSGGRRYCATALRRDGGRGPAVLEIAEQLVSGLLEQAARVHQARSQSVDPVEHLAGARVLGEEQRVRGVADQLLLVGVELGRTEVRQGLH